MAEMLRVIPAIRGQHAAFRVARIAERQWGVVTRAQLRGAGLSDAGVDRWVESGRIHRIHRGVYAVGHRSLAIEGRLAAALLYAGPTAMLSYTTAAWWWGIQKTAPRLIHISAPGRRASPAGVRLHHPRRLEGTRHKRLPATTVERTLLDLSSMLPFTICDGQLRRRSTGG
jgi:predicted transcriptional regulator of viral defense system